MRRCLWAIALLVVLSVQLAYADGIPTFVTQVNAQLFPTFFIGEDALASTFFGPGVGITGEGDWNCARTGNWCSGSDFPPVLAPGSSLTPQTSFLGYSNVAGTVRFGGQAQSVAALFTSTITALSSFTFPTNQMNGQAFTVTVPAVMNLIGGETENGDFFNLQIPRGRLILTFTFEQGQNGFPSTYVFSQAVFTTVPEPGTLGMTLSGLATLAWITVRRIKLTAPA